MRPSEDAHRSKTRCGACGGDTAPAAPIAAARTAFDWLDAHFDRRGIWLGGEPGAGKTMLTAGYLKARALPFLWYRFDADDNDIGAFFETFGAAVPRRGARTPAAVHGRSPAAADLRSEASFPSSLGIGGIVPPVAFGPETRRQSSQILPDGGSSGPRSGRTLSTPRHSARLGHPEP